MQIEYISSCVVLSLIVILRGVFFKSQVLINPQTYFAADRRTLSGAIIELDPGTRADATFVLKGVVVHSGGHRAQLLNLQVRRGGPRFRRVLQFFRIILCAGQTHVKY